MVRASGKGREEGLDGGDLGGFYSNGDWASAGNVMRYNFVHHAKGCNAFYMDDGHSTAEIYHNVAYEIMSGPFIGGGHNHKVHNNLSYQTKKGIHIDDRGIPRKYNKASRKHYKPFQQFVEGNPVYAKSYPSIDLIPDNTPELPTGNLVEDNVIVKCAKGIFLYGKQKSYTKMTVQNNLTLNSNPGFTDVGKLDFTLKPDADPQVMEKLSWLDGHFPKIGLQKDEFRKTLPTVEETGRNAHRQTRQVFDSTKDVDASNRIEGDAKEGKK